MSARQNVSRDIDWVTWNEVVEKEGGAKQGVTRSTVLDDAVQILQENHWQKGKNAIKNGK